MFEVMHNHSLNKQKKCTADYLYLRKPAVHRVIIAQLSVTILVSLITIPFGFSTAISALAGGLCCSVPNAYFIWKAFSYRGAKAAKQVLLSFYQGEVAKFVLTALAFVLVFTLMSSVEPLALFGAFVIVQSVHWITPLLIRQR